MLRENLIGYGEEGQAREKPQSAALHAPLRPDPGSRHSLPPRATRPPLTGKVRLRLLVFSDIHRDADAARRVVECSADADVLVCAGDVAVMREGLQKPVDILAAATPPAVLVAGNGESDEELAAACAGWANAHVLHGSECEIDGVSFWGLGGGVPVTPLWLVELRPR